MSESPPNTMDTACPLSSIDEAGEKSSSDAEFSSVAARRHQPALTLRTRRMKSDMIPIMLDPTLTTPDSATYSAGTPTSTASMTSPDAWRTRSPLCSQSSATTTTRSAGRDSQITSSTTRRRPGVSGSATTPTQSTWQSQSSPPMAARRPSFSRSPTTPRQPGQQSPLDTPGSRSAVFLPESFDSHSAVAMSPTEALRTAGEDAMPTAETTSAGKTAAAYDERGHLFRRLTKNPSTRPSDDPETDLEETDGENSGTDIEDGDSNDVDPATKLVAAAGWWGKTA